ncbi:MAG: formamidopyrimidine-DNA glycosylase [Gammaproteobacteria bacterium]|nr:formamidopyrimidine-DNA glycosylase [Gammaproteobacteria bacterium]
MPELPEVETTKRGVEPYVKNETIKKVLVRNNKLRIPFNKNLAKKIINVGIKEIKRRAKYIIFDFVNGYSVVIHLGMTGNLRVSKKIKYLKHDHIIFYLGSGNVLIYNDVRRFGLIQIYETKESYFLLDNNGPDPFEKEANADYLFSRINNSTASIKSILLNHKIISGIGNIYASEILFATNISPTRIGKKISYDECKNILKESKKILRKAIKAGGTTLNDYFNAESKPGYFKIQLKVYGRDGEKCKSCKSNISKITQSNRSTYYCKESQN